jgi:acyl-CoA thioester hydrolase
MYSAETQLRVRYSETDQMQYVYYGNYATYYEVGRVEVLRKLGMSYRSLEESGIMMPVLETHSYFHRPAKYDDLLIIKITIPKLPLVKIKFDYEIFLEDGVKIHSGDTTLAFIDMKTGKPIKAPERMIALLAPFYNEG